MKRIKQLTIAGVIIASAFLSSCQKENPKDLPSGYSTITNSTKSTYTGCDECINLSQTPVQYFEKTESQTVYWGNGKFDKTVTVVYYNTDTSFVLKVTSTNGWSNLIINGTSVWSGGPIDPNAWGEVSFPLPLNWNACDEYSFNLQVAGGGPQAVFFNVSYQLVGVCQGVTDYDGNVYTTVEICGKTWMAQDLKVTHFNDGSIIPNITDGDAWTGLTTPAYCWYNNDEQSYAGDYGILYNWYTIQTNKLCPFGWHVPTIEEFTALAECLGGFENAGGALKEIGTEHWFIPNTAATNSSGFTALPGGFRSNCWSGYFGGINFEGFWWSTTENSTQNAASMRLVSNTKEMQYGDSDKKHGLYIRCVKDN
jgi:uncharacterized protein (TIGR02145 family)